MSLRGILKELHRRSVFKVAVAYVATGVVLLEVLTHLFHNFEAPHWVLKVITTLLIAGLPVACLAAWGFEFKEGRVRSVPREPKDTAPALPGPAAAAPHPSIAVLPFADMSADHDQQYLGDGIAEELLNALASIEGLDVAARTSSFSFAGKTASMKEIGDTLHVRHVLEGSVRRSGRKLRVTAQLVDVDTGFHRYSQSFDREVQDIFDIQNEIAREMALALLPKLGLQKDALLVAHGTRNLEAYNLRLRAHQWLYNPEPATAEAAVAQLRQAVALDRRYADAWGDLAYVYGYLSTWTTDLLPLTVHSTHAAATSLAHDPDNATALLLLAWKARVFDRDLAAAAQHYEHALQAGVDRSLWAFQKAYVFLGPMAQYDEAIATLKDAGARDPLAPNVKQALLEMYLGAGRVADALAVAEAVHKLPSLGPEIVTLCGLTYVAAGDLQRGRKVYEAAKARMGDDASGLLWITQLLPLAAYSDDLAHVQRQLERMLGTQATGYPPPAYIIGEAYRTLGDYEQAFAWWARAVERYETWALTVLPVRNRNHPVIGRDPRFLALLKRMGLQETVPQSPDALPARGLP